MELILDTNILFSIMVPHSTASYIFSLPDMEFFAPKHIQSELLKYKEDCRAKSKLSEEEFESRWKEIESKIEFSELLEYESSLKEAIEAIPDIKDSPFLALSLSKNKMPIWSNDSHLKQQSLVPVYATVELLDLLLKEDLEESEFEDTKEPKDKEA